MSHPTPSAPWEHRARRSAFAQAAVAMLERAALFLYRWLSAETREQLEVALLAVRFELGLEPPRDPLLGWRDWPRDAEAGDALGLLLRRLAQLERDVVNDPLGGGPQARTEYRVSWLGARRTLEQDTQGTSHGSTHRREGNRPAPEVECPGVGCH